MAIERRETRAHDIRSDLRTKRSHGICAEDPVWVFLPQGRQIAGELHLFTFSSAGA
jgi:hypothetical protein